MMPHTRRWSLCLTAALVCAAVIVLAPSRPAGATDETFITSSALCPIAHCNP